MTYDEFVKVCTGGQEPYEYQSAIARDGLPELLVVPTGAGKTLAVVLGWLYRRRFHPDLAVRAATPRWLVVCQPMRTLVEQVRSNVEAWLTAADLDSGDGRVERFVFMGGEPTADNDWRLATHRDAIIIGTQDMLLSRSLNRGFGSSRYLWPVEFGLLNTGCHWVFDEIQLMGAGVPTGRQLEAFRASFPALLPHGSTWMSATVDPTVLATVDNPKVTSTVTLTDKDRIGPLSKRLTAPKRVTELVLPSDPKQRLKNIASAVVGQHRAGTLTLAIINTVLEAQQLHELIVKLKPDAEVVLMHSRFRRTDRKRLVERVVFPVSNAGRICISTQVVEAGMDLDAATLITEAAPWSSIVQRLGRCNRVGNIVAPDEATVVWFSPAKPDKPRPYQPQEVADSVEVLRQLEGTAVTADGLAERGPAPAPKLHPVLRRRDLLNLFDTMPDISGSDIDVTPWVRDRDDDRTVHIAWRTLHESLQHERVPTQGELCPAPLSKELSTWVDANRVFRYDHLDREWVPMRGRDLRPNLLLLADASSGGYTTERGWEPNSKASVPPVAEVVAEIRELSEAVDDDSASILQSSWVTLSTHLLDTERAAQTVCSGIGISDDHSKVAATAARMHDIGKAHATFQDTMRRGAEAAQWDGFSEHQPLAKSKGRQRHKQKYFRHELASALALLGEARPAIAHLSDDEQLLCIYMVAAHHGRIRSTLRSVPGEATGFVFGVRDGDALPSVRIGDQIVPAVTLAPTTFTSIGADDQGSIPWHELAQQLLDRWGPFALAQFEALVRLADWRASSQPTDEGL
jgi:CRISPR-associated endonuclease/helicase Cas3